MKKRALFILAMAAVIGCSAFTACSDKKLTSNNPPPDDGPIITPGGDDPTNPGGDDPTTPGGTETVYGLPVAATGHYIKDADLLQDGDIRYLVYTTNGESAEEDNVIATRSATEDENGWAYGDETIAVTGTEGAWDEYIGSASIVKGVFEYGDVTYNWLMAYSATSQVNDSQHEIGLAVATDVTGTWTKVGTEALLQYNESVYGTSMKGLYAPSLVSLNKTCQIRIYYTYADAYGHFAQFVDINAADLDALYTEAAKNDVNLISGTNHLPTEGNFASGDAAPMFPNADFAHDSTSGKVVAVKDYSPSAATTPTYADRIELIEIDEREFYTVAELDGWNSLKLWDMMDTPEMAYERLYSACVVTDAYGHVDGATTVEVVYNVCELAVDNADWMFTQNLETFYYTYEVEESN